MQKDYYHGDYGEDYHGVDLYISAQPAGQQPLAGAHLALTLADHAQHGGDTRDNAAARRRGQRRPFASKVCPGNHRLRAPATQIQREGILQGNVSKVNLINECSRIHLDTTQTQAPRNSATLTPSVRASRRLVLTRRITRHIPRSPEHPIHPRAAGAPHAHRARAHCCMRQSRILRHAPAAP